MRFVLKYIREYRVLAFLAPLFKMLEAIFELLVPLVMMHIIDVGIAYSDRSYVLRMCGVLIVLAVSGLGFSITAQYFAAKAAVMSTGKMRNDLFCHIFDFSERQMDEAGSDTLLTRLTSDINAVQGGINMFLRLFLRSPFVVFGAMIMAGTISIRAMLLFAAVIIILGCIVAILMRITIPMYSLVQRKLDGIFTLVRENLEGVRVIRAFARSDEEKEMFIEKNESLYHTSLTAGRWQALLNPLTYGIINLTIVVLLYRSDRAVRIGRLTTGEVVALYNYMSQILVELVKFANLVVQLTRAFASVGRVADVMYMKADERTYLSVEEKKSESENIAVSFKGVAFSYDKGERALEELTFDVERGTTLGVVGGTGSGKSTIARLIRHAYDVSTGQIAIFGKDVKSISPKDMSETVANVPQKVELLSGTVADNLSLGNANVSEEEMWEALRLARADDFIREKGGLQTEIKRGGTNFSGGQRQRLSIARALCAKPKILILDDATSALDASTEKSLLEKLEERSDLTKIIISQRSSSVKKADNILVMDNGWCIGSGTHNRLLKNNDVYREIYEAQYS